MLVGFKIFLFESMDYKSLCKKRNCRQYSYVSYGVACVSVIKPRIKNNKQLSMSLGT